MTHLATTFGSPETIDFRASGSNVHPNLRKMGVKISQLVIRAVLFKELVVTIESRRRFRPVVALIARERAIPYIKKL